jgi:hypothetical protein
LIGLPNIAAVAHDWLLAIGAGEAEAIGAIIGAAKPAYWLTAALVVNVHARGAGEAGEIGVWAIASRLANSCDQLVVSRAGGALKVDIQSEAIFGEICALAVDDHLVLVAFGRTQDADAVGECLPNSTGGVYHTASIEKEVSGIAGDADISCEIVELAVVGVGSHRADAIVESVPGNADVAHLVSNAEVGAGGGQAGAVFYHH